jgi:hypothetical protein
MFEKAASIHILSKQFAPAKALLQLISAPRLHLQYAKAMEAIKSFQEAAASYERAKDYDSMVSTRRVLAEYPCASGPIGQARAADGRTERFSV